MENNIQFIEIDAQKINNDLISKFESVYGETLYPGDERRIFLQQQTQVIVGLKNNINDSALQNLLRYARKEKLDALGEFHRTSRLPGQKSITTLRFTLSSIQQSIVLIPKGTRVTTDGSIYFQTIEEFKILPGQTHGDVGAESMDIGKKYNDFTPGQIKNIVDPIPFVNSVSNIDTSSGGADIEDDERYRERIRQAPEGSSTAGPEGAYLYWAKTADVNIFDVSVSSPSPGVVKIVPLMVNGEIPTDTVIEKVKLILSSKDKRPLTDNVQVHPPTQVSYDIDLTYYIDLQNKEDEDLIKAKIQEAINQYTIWQAEKLGKAINPDELRYRIRQAGAHRVVLVSPLYQSVNLDEVAKVQLITINYGGLE